jgi:hypothetical protein
MKKKNLLKFLSTSKTNFTHGINYIYMYIHKAAKVFAINTSSSVYLKYLGFSEYSFSLLTVLI